MSSHNEGPMMESRTGEERRPIPEHRAFGIAAPAPVIEALDTLCDDETIKVAIYTDGMGTWQARCLDCAWRSRWFRAEQTAINHARDHRHDSSET